MFNFDFVVLTNRQGEDFGERVVSKLRNRFTGKAKTFKLSEIKIENFNNKELNIQLFESVREKQVHLIACFGQGEGASEVRY